LAATSPHKFFKEETMKKLLALSLVLSLAAGAAFAQIPDGFKISAWGRAVFVPIQGAFKDVDPAEDKALTGVGSGWGPGRD
jgi:predicted S18 family serine protease